MASITPQPLLSIAIPTYKRDKYLDRALLSLYKQYDPSHSIEILVSDNCSPDSTSEVVQKYIDLNLPIRYIKNEHNIGPDLNIGQCYYLAKGKYVLTFGDDDVFIDGFLKHILSVLSSYVFGVVFLNYYDFDDDADLEKPRFNFFSNSYVYTSVNIVKVIRTRIGFISASIVNTDFVDKQTIINDAGTNFNQVNLILKAMAGSQKNLYVGKYFIAQQISTSPIPQYFKVFGISFFSVITNMLKEEAKAINWVATHLILNTFTGPILDSRRKNERPDLEKDPIGVLKPVFKGYILFWICNYPIAYLPFFFALLYSYGIRIVAKLFDMIYKIPMGEKLKMKNLV